MMRISCVLAVLLFQVPVGAMAEDLRPFERMDVFGLEWVSDPQISPDGRRVAYVRNGMDVMTDGKWSRLWLIDTDGGENVPLTGRDINESNPAWSPDGSRIAFASKSTAGTEIYVAWVDTEKLPPGHYTLLAVLPNYQTREVPDLSADFEVLAP